MSVVYYLNNCRNDKSLVGSLAVRTVVLETSYFLLISNSGTIIFSKDRER